MSILPQTKRVRREALYSSGASSRQGSPDDEDDQVDLAAAFLRNFKEAFQVEEVDVTASAPRSGAQSSSGPPSRSERSTKRKRGLDDIGNGDDVTTALPAAGVSEEQPEEEDAGYEFNLFRPTPSTAKPTTAQTPAVTDAASLQGPTPQSPSHANAHRRLIRLDSPSLASNPSSATHRPRPDSYYFAAPASATKLAEYSFAAMTGEEVLRRAQVERRYGMRYTWKVTVWPAPASARPSVSTSTSTPATASDKHAKNTTTHHNDEKLPQTTKKRTRLGKKSRVKKRVKMEAIRRAKDARAREAEEKEKHLREKKAKVNRAKQIKKRERERERKKLEGGGDGDAGVVVNERGDSHGEEEDAMDGGGD